MQVAALQMLPTGSGVQVPSGMRLHDWQVPMQAVLQHTPSTQKPEAQAASTAQAAPLGNAPGPSGKSTETTARPGRRKAMATLTVSPSSNVTRTASLT
jgi:hypothetical protein